MSRLGPVHWAGIKRAFLYIKDTLDFGLKFVASDEENFSLKDFHMLIGQGIFPQGKLHQVIYSDQEVPLSHGNRSINPLLLYLPQKLKMSLYARQLKRQFGLDIIEY